jgi:hypothetical protein
VVNANSDATVSQQEFLQSYTSSRRRSSYPTEVAVDAAALSGAAAAALAGGAEGAAGVSGGGSSAITGKQYALLAVKSGLPFVAFGFVDNFIMVLQTLAPAC